MATDVASVDRAKALLESRATQKRYRAMARWHIEEGRPRVEAGLAALERLEIGTAGRELIEAGRHFEAADQLGQLAIVEKLREPKVDG